MSRRALLCAALGLASCGQTATATFPIGVEVEVSADALGLPTELRAMDGTVGALPCGPGGMCPSSAEAPVSCEAGVCDPAPQEVSIAVGDVIDIDAIASDVEALFAEIDRVEILEVDYLIDANTLTFPIEPIEVFWGPEGAGAIDDAMGVRRLGTVPAISAGETGEGSVALDAAGSAALSDHFETTAHRFRVFARTRVDLDPGQPWPEGNLRVSVRMRVRVSGSLL